MLNPWTLRQACLNPTDRKGSYPSENEPTLCNPMRAGCIAHLFSTGLRALLAPTRPRRAGRKEPNRIDAYAAAPWHLSTKKEEEVPTLIATPSHLLFNSIVTAELLRNRVNRWDSEPFVASITPKPQV